MLVIVYIICRYVGVGLLHIIRVSVYSSGNVVMLLLLNTICIILYTTYTVDVVIENCCDLLLFTSNVFVIRKGSCRCRHMVLLFYRVDLVVVQGGSCSRIEKVVLVFTYDYVGLYIGCC